METLNGNKIIVKSDTSSIDGDLNVNLLASRAKAKIDSTEFRNACGAFATGVTVITSKAGNDIQGMTANGFMSVSLNPALIVISVGNDRTIHNTIKKSGRYGVSILGVSQTAVGNHFGGKLDPNLNIELNDVDKTPYLSNSIAYFIARVKSSSVVGDHTLFIGEVEEFGISNHEEPILFSKGQYKTITK